MIALRDYLVPVDADPETNREAWLAERLKGHGGSDVAAILGEHPQKGPIDVWATHVSGVPNDGEDSERSRTGRFLEPYVLQWFAEGGEAWPRLGGPYFVAKPPTVYHRDRPWQRGSADGLIYLPETVLVAHGPELIRSAAAPYAILEIKTHGWYGSKSYDLDDEGNPLLSVPADKRIQCAWYMALYDLDVAYLAALVDTHLRRTFAIHRDRELEAMLLTEVEEFRRKYIQTGEMPPPDGKASYSDYLRGRFKTHGAELVESTEEVDLAVEALVAIKRDQKRLEDERRLAEQVIKRRIGEAAGVLSARGVVTWKSQPSGKLRQKDALAELYAVAGWTDQEIADFEARHALPDNRVLRTPK